MRMAHFVGVAGLAGAGKDLFCTLVSRHLWHTAPKKTIHTKSFASTIKQDTKQTLVGMFGIDPTSCTREEKNKIRDFLVFYGDVLRKKTSGRYWIERLSKEMIGGKDDVFLISDVRYMEYEKDEVQWLQKEKDGIIVHLKIYDTIDHTGEKIYDDPPNDKERFNDPRVQEVADYLIEWPKCNGESKEINEKLEPYIKNFCEWYLEKIK